jgi:hypothetical protein
LHPPLPVKMSKKPWEKPKKTKKPRSSNLHVCFPQILLSRGVWFFWYQGDMSFPARWETKKNIAREKLVPEVQVWRPWFFFFFWFFTWFSVFCPPHQENRMKGWHAVTEEYLKRINSRGLSLAALFFFVFLMVFPKVQANLQKK